MRNESGAEEYEGGRVSALAKERSRLAGVNIRLPSFKEQHEEALFETLLGFIRTRGVKERRQQPGAHQRAQTTSPSIAVNHIDSSS